MQEYGIGIFNTIPSRSALKKAIKKGRVFVDGNPATTGILIKGNEVITLKKPSTPSGSGKQLILPLNVIFEDEHLAVIYKPAGILVSGNSFKTISNALEQNLIQSSRTDAVRPYPVHRLDYPTTGALLIGKTSSSIAALNKMFEEKRVSKTYLAITIGPMIPKGSVTNKIALKEAHSDYEVLRTVYSRRFGRLNLVSLSPKTGRRHQLRIHLASLGNPILGDQQYGRAPLILKGKGLYLHALSLELMHPFTREKLHIKTKLPSKFDAIFPE